MPLTEAVIREYDAKIQPNIFAVVHLHRSIIDIGTGVRLIGSEDCYDAAAYQIMRDLSREVRGKRDYDRRPPHSKRLPNLVTLERRFDFPHLNFCIQRPEWMPFDEFWWLLHKHCRRSDWVSAAPSWFYCEERQGDCVAYALKEGEDSILGRSLSFRPD